MQRKLAETDKLLHVWKGARWLDDRRGILGFFSSTSDNSLGITPYYIWNFNFKLKNFEIVFESEKKKTWKSWTNRESRVTKKIILCLFQREDKIK